MTDDELEAIRARWAGDGPEMRVVTMWHGPSGTLSTEIDGPDPAPTDVAALLAEVDRLREGIADCDRRFLAAMRALGFEPVSDEGESR